MGALATSLVEVPFRKGLDTKTNAKLVLPGSLVVLENGIFTEAGTIKKRNGYVPLAKSILNGANLASGEALATLDSELLLFSAGSLYSWSPSISQWANRGAVAPMTAKARSIIRNTYNQSNPDSASVNGVTVFAWSDGRGGVRACAVDDSSGAVLVADTQLNGTAVRPRCLAVQGNIVIVYQNGANIISRTLTAASPTAFGAEVTLFNDGNATLATQHLDLCASLYGSGAGTGIGACILVYNTNATTIKVAYVRSDGSLGQSSNGYPNAVTIAAAADKSLAVVLRSTGDIYVLYSNATNVSVSARFPDLTQKVAPTVVEVLVNCENITGCFDTTDVLQVAYEVQAALSYNRFVKSAQVTAAGAVSGVAVLKRSVALASKAFLHSTGIYFLTVHDPSPSSTVQGLQNTYFALKIDGTIVGKFQPGTADRIQAGQIPSVVAKDANTFAWCAPVRTQFVTTSSAVGKVTAYSLVGLANLTLSFGAVAYRSAQLGSSLLIAGGFLGCYDGQSVFENGFHLYPENIAAPVLAAGGALEAGSRQIVFVWEWTDAAGQRHRSAPSPAITFVATLNQKATFTIPSLRLTAKSSPRTNVELVAYSTIVGGSDFYKTPNDPATDPVAAPVYNDPTTDAVTFVRSIADVSIQANQLVYTQGGILNNVAPPACRGILVTKNRAFLFGLEDTRRCWVSKAAVRNEGVAFNDGIYVDIDPSGGDLVTVDAIDEKVVFFKRNQIEVIVGDGPDDLGQGSSFTNPVVVTTDCGCVDATSIAATPNGLVFKSDKGIYLLGRDGNASYKGAPVEAYNGQTVVAATLVEKSNQVRFLLGDAKTALVWDYFFDEWTVFTNHGGVDAVAWLPTNAYVYLKSDGSLMVETPGVYTDNAVDIHLRMKTAWIKVAGLQGFQRVRRASFLGDFYSAHNFRVKIGYDYQPFSVDQKVWIPANALQSSTFGSDATFGASSPFGATATGPADLVNQWQIHLAIQKCEAIQFEVEDVGSTPGQSYSLSGLALQVGVLPGGMRLPNAKSL